MAEKKKQSAFMRPVVVTDALAAIVGKDPLPRTEITKKVWEYIHQKGLQDKRNKRQINPDKTLAEVLGSSAPIDMFKMTSKISKHIKEPKLATR